MICSIIKTSKSALFDNVENWLKINCFRLILLKCLMILLENILNLTV